MSTYILSGHEPIREDDLSKWARWCKNADRCVASYDSVDRYGSVKILTIFLAFNQDFSGGQPILFETKVSGGKFDGYTSEYATWDEAQSGHDEIVAMVMPGRPCEIVN